MKRIVYKSLFLLCFLMTSMIGIKAQEATPEKFVKMHPDLSGWIPYGMSNDGRYIVCNNGNARKGNIVKLWDTQSNEVTEIGKDCWAYGISDDGKIVGIFSHPDAVDEYGIPRQAHGFYKDGKWNLAEYYPGYGLEQGSEDGCVWCISPDGKWMSGYIPVAKSSGGFGWYLRPCLWDENGKFVKIFDIEGPKGHMAESRAMSSDGTKIAGFSEIVDGNYLKGVWIPTFWTDVNEVVPIAEDIYKYGSGSFNGMNNSGTIAVGYAVGDGLIMKDDGTVIKVGTGFRGISETGLVVGNGIYSDELGYWELEDFFKDLHGFNDEVEGIVSAGIISDNGEYVCITMQRPDGWIPALVRISGDPLPTIPTKVALMGGENTSINISWEAPRFNGYSPIGYNVYREDVKINTEMITTMAFNDPSPVLGKNCYAIDAVYKYTENGEVLISEKTEEQCVEVISDGECFSPKGLVVDVEYNRTVNLTWKSPYPNYKSSRSEDGEGDELVKIKPNILKSFGFGQCVSMTSDNEYIYGLNTSWRSVKINKYSFDGKLSEMIDLGMVIYSGLAYDGTKYYTTIDNQILVMPEIKIGCDSDAERIVTEGMGSFTRISYLPSLNNNEGGFEVGKLKSSVNSVGTSHYLTKDFDKIEGGGIKPSDAAIMGLASYEDIIYVARRENISSTDMNIFLYNATTNEPTGEYIDLRDYTNLQIAATDQIYGVHVMNSSEGIPCLVVIFGNISIGTRLAFLELANMEGLIGYNVFRNNVKINVEPIANSYYTEKLFDAGSYEYKVTALFDGGCVSTESDPVNVTITQIGVVNEPKNIVTEALRDNIIVSWEAPKSSAIPKLVGYNVFRNGVKLNKEGEYITDLFYVDKDLALGEYKYEVNAFYNNSGESMKLSNTITLDGFNPTLAPTELIASQEDRENVDLIWKTPAMGDYEVKTWHNGNIENRAGISEEGGILYVATKWDANDLGAVFNYTLSDIEFYAGEALAYTFYIYIDDKLVGTQTMEKAKAMDYNILKLTTPITIEKGKTLMVACKVTHDAGELPMGISKRNNAIGKGDLTSIDGTTWVSVFESEGFEATWAISIRLMPYTLETPKEIVDVEMEANLNKNIKIVSDTEIMRSMAATAVFKNSEVIGYNIYKNDEKINTTTVDSESFKDTSVDFTKNNCYSVEALFTADRKSPKSVEACTFGACEAPVFSGAITDGYPQVKATAPTETVVNKEIKYYEEEGVDAISMITEEPYYTLLSLKPTDLSNYDGYTITAINAFLAGNDFKVTLFAKQGDKVIINQAINSSDIQEGFNEWAVKSPVMIDANSGLMIGLMITADINTFTVSIDAGNAIDNKTNVMSMNAISYSSLKEISSGQITGSWNISLSLEKKQALEEKCIGYNIYRDDIKITEEPITAGLYVDKTAEGGKTYKYHATALWDTNCESEASDKVSINLTVVNDLASANIKVYPNPAKDMLNIEGDVKTVRFYNLVGQEYSQQNVEGGRTSIDVSAWARGIYIIEVISATGEVNRGKVIIK